MDVILLRRQRLRTKRQHRGHPFLSFLASVLAITLIVFLGTFLLGVGAVYSVYASYVKELPTAEEISRRSVDTFETTRIYDRTGKQLLYEIIPDVGGRRTEVPLSRIPAMLRNATIAMEDKTFYTNPAGVNVEGLARAAWGVVSGEYAGGGSSIPQQLIRTVLMTPEERMERNYERKLKEVILAYELTRRYPGVEGRDQILEWYLNNIFYGHFAYGVEAAAQTYFNKHVEELNLAEIAMIVPLGNTPAYNPIDRPEEAKKRQEVVLDQLYLQSYITAEEAYAAKRQSLNIAPPRFDIQAPHYVLQVRRQLEEKYGSNAVYGGGLQVIAAIDMPTQNKVQALAREHIAKVRDEHNANNAALVVIDTPSGEVRAMVGSLDYFDRTIDGEVNMAVSPRQPGSSFKIFTYSAAFAQGYTPATMVMDVRTSFPDPSRPAPYVPENSGRTFSGPALLRKALGSSLNIPAVAMAAKVGLPAVLETARAMGITTLNEPFYGLSLALGSAGATLLDMTYAYSVLANGGTMIGAPIDPAKFKPGYRQLDPVMILQVTDAKGNLLYKYDEPHQQEVLRPEVAFLVTDILSDNNARGPGLGYDSALKVKSRPAAAKTGTTNDYHDAWTLGYTPQYVVGVWVGNANYEEMTRAYAMEMAGPLWNQTIEMLHDGLPVLSFPRPAGIVAAVVDSVSGKLPTDQSPQRAQEIFIKGTVPTESDDVHKLFRLCKQTSKLATAYCPPEQVEEKVFEVYSTDAQDWMRENKVPMPPEETCHLHGPNLSTAEVAISSPRHLASVRATVPITGSARPGGFQKYALQFGPGLTPKEWTPIGGEHGNAVDNNLLEWWDVRSLEGLYTLQLNVVAGGNTQQATVQVLVDNISPTIKLLAPEKDELIALDKDEWVNMQVLAADNIAIAKVEFFMDGKALGISTVAPYTYRLLFRDWKEKEPLAGDHIVWVIAYDAAGNQQKSEEVPIKIGTEAQKRATATAVAQKP